jgi:hypothetical protein
VSKRAGQPMKSAEIPDGLVARLQSAMQPGLS